MNREIDLTFKHPTRVWQCGCSGVGKTLFTIELVRHRDVLFNVRFARVLWFFFEDQPAYEQLRSMSGVELIRNLPEDDEVFQTDIAQPKLIVIDDAMSSLSPESVKLLGKLYYQGSHHWNLTVITLMQAAFVPTLRTMRINSPYLILFKSVSDRLSIANIGKQIFPGDSKYFISAYLKATERPYTYLLVDLEPRTPDWMRLRSGILPTDGPVHIYIKESENLKDLLDK